MSSAVFDTDEEAIKQYNRLRREVGASSDNLTDDLAEEYFVEALEEYPNDTAKMIAYSRVIALQEIRGNAMMLGKYAQNQSMEDLTMVFKNVSDMLKDAEAKVARVADAIDTETVTPFFFGVAQGQRGR